VRKNHGDASNPWASDPALSLSRGFAARLKGVLHPETGFTRSIGDVK
jgi:hypothetical protein